jgi:hypothetical protein
MKAGNMQKRVWESGDKICGLQDAQADMQAE